MVGTFLTQKNHAIKSIKELAHSYEDELAINNHILLPNELAAIKKWGADKKREFNRIDEVPLDFKNIMLNNVNNELSSIKGPMRGEDALYYAKKAIAQTLQYYKHDVRDVAEFDKLLTIDPDKSTGSLAAAVKNDSHLDFIESDVRLSKIKSKILGSARKENDLDLAYELVHEIKDQILGFAQSKIKSMAKA